MLFLQFDVAFKLPLNELKQAYPDCVKLLIPEERVRLDQHENVNDGFLNHLPGVEEVFGDLMLLDLRLVHRTENQVGVVSILVDCKKDFYQGLSKA